MFTPTLVKVLRFFRQYPGGGSRERVLEALQGDSLYLDRALEHLCQSQLIYIETSSYQPLPALEDFAEKMFRLYDKINRRSQRDLLVRGLLCAVRERGYLMSLESLVRLLEQEGFEPGETLSFVQEETRQGHISKIRVSVGSRRAGVLPPLPCLPLSDLRPTDLGDSDDLKDMWRDQGVVVWEGDYLIANYPVELSAPALLFLDVEGAELKMRLREETLQAWTRYRSGDFLRP